MKSHASVSQFQMSMGGRGGGPYHATVSKQEHIMKAIQLDKQGKNCPHIFNTVKKFVLSIQS